MGTVAIAGTSYEDELGAPYQLVFPVLRLLDYIMTWLHGYIRI